MFFKYKGFFNDEKVENIIEATSLNEAKNILLSKNIFFTEIQLHKNKSNLNYLFKKKLNNKFLIKFSRSILLYIQSSIPIIKAIELLMKNDNENKKIKQFYQNIHTLINEGKSFYQALNQQNIFEIPDFYKESIKVAEENGFLENTLEELILFIEEQEEINQQIVNSMFYPLFIVFSSILMISVMIISVVPKIIKMFEQNKQELPNITIYLIKISDFLQNNFLFIIFFIIISTIIHKYSIKYFIKYKKIIDNIKLKIPFFGNILLKSELSRISYLLSILNKSGIPLVQSIKLSSNTINNLIIKEIFQKSSNLVVEGKNFSNTLKFSKNIPIDFIQSIELGEETSEMPKILLNISKMYISENKNKIKILLSLIEPIMMLIVGSIIGLIVAAMILPIFSMNIG